MIDGSIMKFGFGKIGQTMRTNLKGGTDAAGAANQFREMAKNTTDPAKAKKYEQLADQWSGTAMQGGFMSAMMTGGLGIPGSTMQQYAQQAQQGGFLDTAATHPLAGMAGQGYGFG